MGLISLVYISLSTSRMKRDDLLAILETSKRNNQARDITGMLLYRDRYFIQALEGKEDIVMSSFDTISKDPRHDNVMVVAKLPIAERSFNNWSMGFRNLDELDLATYPGYTDFLTQPFHPELLRHNPNRARMLLEAFKEDTL